MPAIIAHRGSGVGVGENTIGAFEAARRVGADMAELDVQELADGELVVMHESAVHGLPLAGMRLEEFRALVPAPNAPRLEDVLNQVELPLDIEIKQADPERVLATVFRSARAHCVFTSFDPTVIEALGAVAHESVRGLLIPMEEDLVSLGEPDLSGQLISRAMAVEASLIAIEAPLASPSALAAVAEELAPSIVWTVNDDDALRSLLANQSVSGVVTDRLDLIEGVRAADSVSADS